MFATAQFPLMFNAAVHCRHGNGNYALNGAVPGRPGPRPVARGASWSDKPGSASAEPPRFQPLSERTGNPHMSWHEEEAISAHAASMARLGDDMRLRNADGDGEVGPLRGGKDHWRKAAEHYIDAVAQYEQLPQGLNSRGAGKHPRPREHASALSKLGESTLYALITHCLSHTHSLPPSLFPSRPLLLSLSLS
jgi:hypothetical protein